MFSDKNRLKTDTLEYSWLLEILLGDVTGASSNANSSRTARSRRLESCDSRPRKRLSIRGCFRRQNRSRPSVQLWSGSILTRSHPLVSSRVCHLRSIRLSTCNSHTNEYAKDLLAAIWQFALKMFINEANRLATTPVVNSASNLTGHRHHHRRHELELVVSR